MHACVALIRVYAKFLSSGGWSRSRSTAVETISPTVSACRLKGLVKSYDRTKGRQSPQRQRGGAVHRGESLVQKRWVECPRRNYSRSTLDKLPLRQLLPVRGGRPRVTMARRSTALVNPGCQPLCAGIGCLWSQSIERLAELVDGRRIKARIIAYIPSIEMKVLNMGKFSIKVVREICL